ncbi:DUF1643 domain-containing protein [Phormidesmis sp. 146-35]
MRDEERAKIVQFNAQEFKAQEFKTQALTSSLLLTTYRYSLERSWSDAPRVGFVMLNPNRADEVSDDPTIRRCIGFAKSWGYGGLEVANLFAYRAKTPDLLKQADDPIGKENDRSILRLTKRVETIVLAWGNWGMLGGRDRTVIKLLDSHPTLYCLGTTKLGQPRHPLYLKSTTLLVKFSLASH